MKKLKKPSRLRSPSIQDKAPELAYQPSLDGLRAVAVLGVMAYHANLPWAAGGFLGVDVFFVLSGFLITSLLAREHDRTTGIGLARFYMRRTLRLLPALLVLAAALQVWSIWFVFPWQLAQLRRETLATLFYVANWAEAFGRLRPLGFFGHAWSLAIEEQFYIAWPLVLRTMLPRLSRPAILALVAATAAASALERAVLWQGPDTFARVFHGSDTRAEALLVGCFLALWLSSHASVPRRAVQILGVAGAGAVVVLFNQASPISTWMYHGGFTITALATALVILELRTSPRGALAVALAWPPLVATGRISYGLYLWHWPVYLCFTPDFLGWPSVAATAVRFAVSFAMAIVSWFVVERRFLRWKQAWS